MGEIYQYTLEVKPGYEHRYDAMELRTIQDWIVRRYLSGIPGVNEINTWGGFLKQYEVAIDPQRLQALDITAAEVLTALEQQNAVTGGGYIERNQTSYFIRGEGRIQSLQEVGEVVITQR
ncbi:efflux RND transporter permease subunit, partial [Arthrospira platensis SPKY1]|nr:efflux RND transporter permease subunit [Arthrospira platensis SPKY1]